MSILFRLGLIGWIVLLFFGATTWLKASADKQVDKLEVALNFETLFPDTPYKRLHHACITIWQDLRSLQNKVVEDEQLRAVHKGMIEKLALVYGRVFNLLKKPNTVSPDDLEYLAGLLHLINIDFNATVRTPSPETICSQVLIERIQHKVESILK